MWLKLLIAFFTVVLLVSGCSAQLEDPKISVRYIAQGRSIPSDFLGVNGESLTTDLMGKVWQDPNFRTAAKKLHPGNIRIFGGTSANLWGWRQGRLIGPPLPGIEGYRAGVPSSGISLDEILDVTREAGATPLFDLNLVSSTLADQIAMLRAAQRLGVPVKRVELGNELYSAPYASVFADGRAYARAANRWIAALHHEFPGVLVAVDAAMPDGSTDERRAQWNRELFATMRDADAATLHQYFAPVTRAADLTSSEAQREVEAPTSQWRTRMLPALASIPSSLPVWVTEWNYRQSVDPQTLTWARALGNAEFAVRLAANRRVRLADYHSIVDGGGVGFGALTVSTSRGQPTRYPFRADGAVLRVLTNSLNGCTRARAVGIDALAISGRDPSLVGISCEAPQGKPIVLVNPTRRSLRLDVSAVTVGSSVQVRTISSHPTARGTGLAAHIAAHESAESVQVSAWSLVSITSSDRPR